MPGQRPAQDARSARAREAGHVRSGLGDDHVDREPLQAGDGQQQRVDGIEGGGPSIDLRGEGADGLVKEVEVAEDALGRDGVVGPEVTVKGLGQRRDLRPHLALGELGQSGRVLLSFAQRLDHGAPGLSQDLGSDGGELDPGVLEDLLQALDLGNPGVDLGLAVTGELPQRPDRWWRHEARPHHPMSGHIGQPLRIRQVSLAAGDLLNVAGVTEPHRESALQRVVDGLPVHACSLHGHEVDPTVNKPGGQDGEPGRRRCELLLLPRCPTLGAQRPEARRDAVSVHVQSSHSIMDLVHLCLLPTVSIADPPGRDLGENRIWGSCS